MFRRKNKLRRYTDFTLKYKGKNVRVSNFIERSIHESFALVYIDDVELPYVSQPLTREEVLELLKKGKPIK